MSFNGWTVGDYGTVTYYINGKPVSEDEFLKQGFTNSPEHSCKFTKQVPLLRSVIGVCECGKEKELDWNEINLNKQD